MFCKVPMASDHPLSFELSFRPLPQLQRRIRSQLHFSPLFASGHLQRDSWGWLFWDLEWGPSPHFLSGPMPFGMYHRSLWQDQLKEEIELQVILLCYVLNCLAKRKSVLKIFELVGPQKILYLLIRFIMHKIWNIPFIINELNWSRAQNFLAYCQQFTVSREAPKFLLLKNTDNEYESLQHGPVSVFYFGEGSRELKGKLGRDGILADKHLGF